MFRNKFKILIIFLGCFLFRLIPLRAPNVEPIMASIMPISKNIKKYGVLIAFLFGFLSIFLFDLVTHFGSWTWFAGITYGLIGVASVLYFKKFKSSVLNFAVFAFFATIMFDLITGVLFAPVFHQTILNALMLQIPFTLLHLAGNIGFAVTLSPILNKWILSERMFGLKKVTQPVAILVKN
jgi:uncharacterized membrane protein